MQPNKCMVHSISWVLKKSNLKSVTCIYSSWARNLFITDWIYSVGTDTGKKYISIYSGVKCWYFPNKMSLSWATQHHSENIKRQAEFSWKSKSNRSKSYLLEICVATYGSISNLIKQLPVCDSWSMLRLRLPKKTTTTKNTADLNSPHSSSLHLNIYYFRFIT